MKKAIVLTIVILFAPVFWEVVLAVEKDNEIPFQQQPWGADMAALDEGRFPRTSMTPAEHDPYGLWKKSRDFEKVKKEGAQVVLMPEEHNFFAYYIPPNYRSGRIMVGVHGTGGNPYIELRDEMEWAKQFDYAVIAMNWLSREKTGRTPEYLDPKDLYRNILQALNFFREKTGNDLSRVAYIGFSRGSAISYEIAYRDRQSQKVFDLMISHSGGIPQDLRIEARNPSAKPEKFFSDLIDGTLGPEPLKGAAFFLYSGDKDEQWGEVMSQQLEHARDLILRNGGEVLEWVRDPEGGHLGLRKNRSINEKAVRYFIEQTP